MMDSASSKSRLKRAFSRVLHVHFAPENQKSKASDDVVVVKNVTEIKEFKRFDDADEKLRLLAVEAFLARVFASVSALKAAYAQLQLAQSPYDPDGICVADKIVVSELTMLSRLKQRYLNNQIDYNDYDDDEQSPQTKLLLAEIQEQKCTLRTYDITGRKMCAQIRLKDSEIEFLREKLAEINQENNLLENRLNDLMNVVIPNNDLSFSELSLGFFVKFLEQTTESIQSFCHMFCREMKSAGLDLYSAARSIQPKVAYWNLNHIFYAFESYISSVIFHSFNHQNFSISSDQNDPKSDFPRFCSKKYLTMIHPRIEESLFGNLEQRAMVESGEWPEAAFFSAFSDMAKRVWLLHCLAFSFDDCKVSIFRVNRRTPFSEVFMETVNEEAFLLSDATPEVGFTVIPGFRIGTTVVQCQVYLC